MTGKAKKVTQPVPPRAEKIKTELTLHNHTRVDNYFWLNQRENPKVIAYLNAENDYWKASLKQTEGFRERLYKEITARINKVEQSVPYRSNGYYYYRRYESGKEYPLYCRKKETLDAKEEIILNVDQMAKGHKFYVVQSNFHVSPDNKLLAFGVDNVSRRKYTIQIKDLATGKMLPEKIPNTDGAPYWANDNKTIFYGIRDKTLKLYKIFSHRIGTPVSQDKEVYHEKDEAFRINLDKSKSGKYIFVFCSSTLSTEYLYLDANQPDSQFKPVIPRRKHLEYSAEHYGDRWIIRTNENAKNFKLISVPIDPGNAKKSYEIVPHNPDVFIEDIEIFKNFLVILERKKGIQLLRVTRYVSPDTGWDSETSYYIDFDEPTYCVYAGGNKEFDTPVLRYKFESLVTPKKVVDFDMNTKKRTLMKQEKVMGYDSSKYEAQWLWATATDGTKIPISLVRRKDIKQDGTNPLLLYGYGSYGSNMDVDFEVKVVSLLDRGFIYAIAHIRGGQEMGRAWYESGKLLKKKNTFTDFIDCARFLVDQKYTTPEKLFAQGGSAGGLLMGAVINMRPDLFKAVVANVPFVDVVTTMLDKSIPLTTSEFNEWGDPGNKEYYDYMLSYSPYDKVSAVNYPALLVTTGLHDSQVQYWEPAKWVAKMRELKKGNSPLFLFTNMSGGHGGASGRYKKYKLAALSYAFIMDQIGIKN